MLYINFFGFSLPLAFWLASLVDRGTLLRYRRKSMLVRDVDALRRIRVREAIFALMISLGFWYSIGITYVYSPACPLIFCLFLLQAIQPDAIVTTKALAGAE
ncbi:MAG: hypothetical protein ACP5O7_12930 [Phycisphaerae bacterium]